MPSSSPQAVLTDEQLADFTELATRLERIFTGEAKDREFVVPSYLIDAFLRIQTPIRAQHLQQVIDVLHKYEADVVQSLNTTSVHCLAYLLLNLDVESEQETALNLLLDESNHVVETKRKRSEVTLLRFRNQLQLVQRKLTQTLYDLFIDERRNKQLRRLAGKCLVEILPGTKDVRNLPFEIEEEDISRFISIMLYENDAVTRFFATTFIQTLHLSQKEIERLGHAYDVKLADMLSRSMFAFPEEPVKFFHHHECEVQRIQREPEKCTILVPSCDLVLSNNGENKTLGQESELLGVVSPESLTFILAVARPSGKFYQFIHISMRSILESMRTFRQYTDSGMSRLILQFDVDASLSVNGKRQISGESTLSITSHHDLTDLYTTIETNGKQIKRQSTELSTLTRMSSSIIISLDTYDDVIGSFDYSQTLFENEEQHSRGCLESNGNQPENKTCESQATSGSHEHGSLSQRPESARGTPAMRESLQTLHLLNLDHSVSKQHGGERASLAVERKLPERGMAEECGNPPTLKEYSGNSAENPHKGLFDCALAETDNGTRKKRPPHVHSSQSQGSEEKDAGWLPVQKSRPRPRRQQQKKGLTSSKKARGLMPDTQESLIFPTRHSTRKNYTHARASVDWDEDLRPSNEPEQLERQKSIDATSISSPPAGEKSVFDQAARKGTKRKSKGKTSSSKRRKTSQKAGLDNREGKRETEESNLVQESIPEGTVDVTNVPSMNAERATSKGSRTKADQAPKDKTVAGGRTLTDDAPDVALVAVTEVSGVEQSIAFLMDQAQEIGCPLIFESFSATGDQHAGQTSNRQIEKASSDRDETQTISYPGFKQNGLGGRGRVVGEKLATAIHDGCSFSPAGEERQEDATIPDGDTGSLHKDVGRHAMSALALQHEDAEPRAVKVQPQDAFVTRTNRTTQLSSDAEPAVAEEQTSQKYPEIIQQISSTKPRSRKRGAGQTEKENASRKKRAQKKLSTVASAESESQVDKPGPQSQELCGPRKSELGLCALKAGLENGREQISTGERETVTSGYHSLKSIRPRQKPEDGSSDQAGPKILSPVKTIPRLTPRKTIVDNNGSPRLVSRHTARSQRSTHTNLDFEQGHGAMMRVGMSTSQEFSESGYEADFDEHPEGEIPLENPRVSSFRTKMDAHRRESLPRNCQTATHEEVPGETPVTGGRKGLITSKLVTASGKEFTMYFSSKPPQKSPRRLDMSNAGGDGVTQFSSKEDGCSIDSGCGPTETSPSSEELPGQADLATSLQSLHESARDVLLVTNEHLLDQLDKERAAINKFLNSYRQQYNRVLDQLVKKQEERIKLCKQQMKAIKSHHSDLCQELIHRLQEQEQCLLKDLGEED